MDSQSDVDRMAQNKLRKLKIFTLALLMELLACSRSTAQRRLRQWRCLTSYNSNGGYYALPDVPVFDTFGIWRHQQACFSRYGNLLETVRALVENAPAGLSATELSEILGINAHSFIWSVMRNNLVSREKVHHHYVYLALDAEQQRRQRQQRLEQHAPTATTKLALVDAIVVLVELIKNPTLSCDQLARRVKARAPTASTQAIAEFLLEHGLPAPKKGRRSTARMRSKSSESSSPS